MGGRKYIGYSNNIQYRLYQHFNGFGAKWTQKYSPLAVSSLIYVSTLNEAKKLETDLYYSYKKHFGWQFVRGAGNTRSY